MADERTIIVTGGARGIGLACARRFVEDGDRVVIADVDDAEGETVAEDLGDRALFVKCDVGERLDVHNLIAETLTAWGRIDGLVNNAALVAPGDILSLDEADFDRVMRVNLRGAFVTAQAVARQIVSQIETEETRADDNRRRYAIVNMSSINAAVALPGQLAYVCAKHGLNGLTRAMALALASRGVRVNGVGPGSVNTDMLKSVSQDAEAQARLLSRTPLGRIADPDEVAAVASFLMSSDASYVTGECIYVDGGRLALNMTVES